MPRITFRLNDSEIAVLKKYQKENMTITDALKNALTRLQYLEDLALEEKHKEFDKNIPKSEDAPECFYHAQDIDSGQWYCDVKKIPPIVCLQRHKRFTAMNRKCRPSHLKPKPKIQKQEPQKTRIVKDEFERAYYPDDYFRDDWGGTDF